MLVAIEGGDKCGKSTLAYNFNKKYNCEIIKFPNRESLTGRVLDCFLKGGCDLDKKTVHELFAANRMEMLGYLNECSKSDEVYFLDRYVYSGAAYSICHGLEMEWCIEADKSLPEADLVIWLNPALDIVEERIKVCTDAEIYESVGFQKMLDTAFRSVFSYVGARVVEITMPGTADDVFNECIFQLQQRFDLTTE